MLFEKITYQDDFPINITIANIEDYPIHYHQDIEFVFVLKGQVTLKNGYCSYTLHERDIFTNSGHEVHSLTSEDPDNIVALIQISTHYFSQYFPSLSKACYRTYTNKGRSSKHDNLQEKLLDILLQYSIRSSRYKTECTYAMIEVIKYLERIFNLFAFNGEMVINFESSNPVTIERISHIIGYIYQNYAEKITLDDLAEIEHLSTFYLSHIIKDCTGMNFREFLCFARVEWSEIQLLDTNKKISQIAKDVGFSTTSYYEKYFRKWFGHSPQAHREMYMPMVKSEFHRETLTLIPPNKAITLIRNLLSSLNSQKNSTSLVNTLKLEIDADIHTTPLAYISHNLIVQIRCEDFAVMGFHIFSKLANLHPETVVLLYSDDDSSQQIDKFQNLLLAAGFEVECRKQNHIPFSVISSGNDSIAYPIHLIHKLIRSEEKEIQLPLRDYDTGEMILGGQPALLTANGTCKPGYFACQLLSFLKGNLLCWGKQYCVIKTHSDSNTAYVIIVSNFNEEIYEMCTKETTAHQAKTILNEFKDEIDFNVSLNLTPGMYSVMKYSLTKNRNIFAYLSAFDFNDDVGFHSAQTVSIPTEPELELYIEDVRTTFNMNFSMKGVELQYAVIRLKGDSKDA